MRLGAAIVALFLLAACSTSSVLSTSRAPVPTSESPKYAAIVVDAHTRRVLYSAHADEIRYPASLTKMMTLYLLFEAVESGRIPRDAQIPISANAAARPASKLYLKAGQTIDLDTAIKALCTKSANDVATAVAEYLGGTEERFAAMMTATARRLGMRDTVFTNASGLPDPGQRTTARDMAALGMALRTRFPRYYPYFSLREFQFNGKTITGHNDILRRVRGADGIKTGYTRASGYNLVTSVNADGKRIVAVVMGEESSTKRNDLMEQLIQRFLPRASRR